MRAVWVVILAACSSGAVGESPVIDAAIEDSSVAADGISDVGTSIEDTGDASPGVDTTDVAEADEVIAAEDALGDGEATVDVEEPADASGDDAPDTPSDASVTCGELAAAYGAIAQTLDQCSVGSECAWHARPVCGANCAVAVNASADLSALEAAWQDFSAAGCVPDPIVPECCDLPPATDAFGCSAGTCVPCDYECDLNCECKQDAIGCDIPECEATNCATLTQAVDDAVKANDDCAAHADCQRFEHPICGSIGCYQRAVSKGAPMDQLGALAQAAQEAGCEPFHCGCDVQGEPLCIAGACTLCPGSPGCPDSCDELRDAIKAVAASGSACTTSAECTMLSTPFCDSGKGLGCNALAVSGYSPVNAATALLKQFSDLKCQGDDCDCYPAEVPICKDGACLPFYYVQ